jgi:hypothetical protein
MTLCSIKRNILAVAGIVKDVFKEKEVCLCLIAVVLNLEAMLLSNFPGCFYHQSLIRR